MTNNIMSDFFVLFLYLSALVGIIGLCSLIVWLADYSLDSLINFWTSGE